MSPINPFEDNDFFIRPDDINLRTDSQVPDQYDNRGNDTKAEELSEISVQLIDIDTAIIKYMTDIIKPTVTSLEQTKIDVPVMYANPERWKSVRRDGVLRDRFNKLQIPLILIRRLNMIKNSLNIPINTFLEKDFASVGWNPRNKYDRFAIQNRIHPSQRFVSVVYPDYYDIDYEVVIWSDFQVQMNEIVQQISFQVENYWGERDKYKFRTSVREYTNISDLPDMSDRLVRSQFVMRVNAYILPESYINKYWHRSTTNKNVFSIKKVIVEEKFIE